MEPQFRRLEQLPTAADLQRELDPDRTERLTGADHGTSRTLGAEQVSLMEPGYFHDDV